MKFPEVNEQVFYTVGKYAFFTIALIGLIRIVDLWSSLKSYEIFSSLANTIFYFILSMFFGNLQKKNQIATVNDKDIFKMNEALDKLNLEDKDEKGQDRRRRRSNTRNPTKAG